VKEKIFPNISMPANEKIYHIYAKDQCLFHCIKEEDFKTTWNTLKNMVGLMKTDYTVDDLSFEELLVNRD
jgi:hypothetical protein